MIRLLFAVGRVTLLITADRIAAAINGNGRRS
jgi:hypothetical protein